uniref:Uncharacterized protein n=1 Tax=Octopus bimaculoides TaxID=37653 RepID=A0A0L8GDN4_OCTBM
MESKVDYDFVYLLWRQCLKGDSSGLFPLPFGSCRFGFYTLCFCLCSGCQGRSFCHILAHHKT